MTDDFDDLLKFFDLEGEENLHRLARFLLLHALIDRHLIHLLAVREFPKRVFAHLKQTGREPRDVVPEDIRRLDALLTEYADRKTFGDHLDLVRQRSPGSENDPSIPASCS